MPELPEIAHRTRQMQTELVGKTIAGVDALQPKCLNLPPEDFAAALSGATIQSVTHRGKWIMTETTQGWFLLSLGMGGEVLLVTRETLPTKYRLIIDFTDHSCLAVNFWWFGYAHYAALDALQSHEMTAKLGPNVLDLTPTELQTRLQTRRGRIKALLLDQSVVAGIGNAYIHDILFLAQLHPQRKVDTLTTADFEKLAQAIHDGLQPSLDKGGAFYEVDLHGRKGGFLAEDIIIGYREGQPCPTCGATIEKIKTGSTSSFICPVCQPLTE